MLNLNVTIATLLIKKPIPFNINGRSQTYKLSIINTLGETIAAYEIRNQNTFTLSRAGIPSGLYIYILSDDEERANVQREGKLKSGLRSLGCYPLKTIHTPHGGSIHYAGTLPFDETQKPFTLSPQGRLAGTKTVFVADGSGFRYLPAKGLTLTLMANAHQVAQHAMKND